MSVIEEARKLVGNEKVNKALSSIELAKKFPLKNKEIVPVKKSSWFDLPEPKDNLNKK